MAANARAAAASRENGQKGGRPRQSGSLAAATVARHAQREELARAMHEALGGDTEFQGNSYDLLVKVYKSPAFPVPVRIDAAQVCIKYEKPMLQSVVIGGDQNNPLQIIHNIMGLCNGTGRDLPSKSGRAPVSQASSISAEYTDGPALEVEQPLPSEGQGRSRRPIPAE